MRIGPSSGLTQPIQFQQFARIYIDTSGSMVAAPGFEALWAYLKLFHGKVFQVSHEVEQVTPESLPFQGGFMAHVMHKHWAEWAVTQSPHIRTLFITDEIPTPSSPAPGTMLASKLFYDNVAETLITDVITHVPSMVRSRSQNYVTQTTLVRDLARAFANQLQTWAVTVERERPGDERAFKARQFQHVLNDLARYLTDEAGQP